MLAGEREHKAGNSKLLVLSGEMLSWDTVLPERLGRFPQHQALIQCGAAAGPGCDKTRMEGGGRTRLGPNACILFMALWLSAEVEGSRCNHTCSRALPSPFSASLPGREWA